MSWICKKCETENPDSVDSCEVCDTKAPRIVNFSYDKILTKNPITIYWTAESCDNISIVYGGEQSEVTGMESFEISNPNETEITFLLSNVDTTTRTQCFSLNFLEKPIIEFKSNKIKLLRNKEKSVVLSWSIRNYISAHLMYNDNDEQIGKSGTLNIEQSESTRYVIEVLALDNTTIFSEELNIGVFDECEIEFFADKYHVFPTIPVTLSWNVKYAKKVWLDDEAVDPIGSKVVEPSKAVSYVLSAKDEFGKKSKRIDIGMLPIPQVKSLLVPTPRFVSKLSVVVKQPRYNVDVKFPAINLDWIKVSIPKVEIPKVMAFTDLGLNVELSFPLPKVSLIGSVISFLKNVIKK